MLIGSLLFQTICIYLALLLLLLLLLCRILFATIKWQVWDVYHLAIELLLQTGQLYSSLSSATFHTTLNALVDGVSGGSHGCRCVLPCMRVEWRVDRAFSYTLLCCLHGAELDACFHARDVSRFMCLCRILVSSQTLLASLSLYANPLPHIVSFVWWERLLIQQHRAALSE